MLLTTHNTFKKLLDDHIHRIPINLFILNNYLITSVITLKETNNITVKNPSFPGVYICPSLINRQPVYGRIDNQEEFGFALQEELLRFGRIRGSPNFTPNQGEISTSAMLDSFHATGNSNSSEDMINLYHTESGSDTEGEPLIHPEVNLPSPSGIPVEVRITNSNDLFNDSDSDDFPALVSNSDSDNDDDSDEEGVLTDMNYQDSDEECELVPIN